MVKVQVPMPDPEDPEIDDEDDDDDIDDPDWEEVTHQSDDDYNQSQGVKLNLSTRTTSRAQKRGTSLLTNPTATIEIGQNCDEENEPKKRKLDFDEIVRRKINRKLIEKQLNKHKMSLLLYLARGIRLVTIIKHDLIKALSLSLIDKWLLADDQTRDVQDEFRLAAIKEELKDIEPKQSGKKSTTNSKATRRSSRNPAKKQSKLKDENANCDAVDLNTTKKVKKLVSPIKGKSYRNEREYIQVFMNWFNELITIDSDDDEREKHLNRLFMLNIIECFSKRIATNILELVVMFAACLKAARPDLHLRLINILRPITMRAEIIVKPDSKQPPPNLPKYSTEEKLDYWLEVYLQDEKRWICVDLCNAKLDEPNVLNELNKPFFYLVSFDIDRNCIKSVESTYCPDWYTPSFKRERCDPKWWNTVMKRLGPSKDDELDNADEERNQEILQAQDIPKSEAGFKNHPLYVIEKHLLKFQGIYPPEVAPVGFFKEMPVYPRDCVHTLMSRDKWLRSARSVKLNETPYKIVKARPKRDRYSGELVRDLPLELFGEWQTEDYDPPAAENGKVPRNAYGNVDMYKECMLPKGCTWLKLNGLPKIANKLKIDCAAAVIGFDCNSGNFGSHPIIDGFIVCNEHAETLQMAWEEEQENARRREIEKRQKRIFDNWKRLIKAASIRDKLRCKYQD